jgi:hypothetical protein
MSRPVQLAGLLAACHSRDCMPQACSATLVMTSCLPPSLPPILDTAGTGSCGILPVVQAMGKAFGTLRDNKIGKTCDR